MRQRKGITELRSVQKKIRMISSHGTCADAQRAFQPPCGLHLELRVFTQQPFS
jgi:hypothetical protein